MEVYLVIGGCPEDQHVIAVYQNEKAAEARAKSENRKCKGLEAYTEKWRVEKMKQWHTITFSANLDQDDIKAMNKCFYDAMKESMEISECANLMIRAEYE